MGVSKAMLEVESRPSVWRMNMMIFVLYMPVVVVFILGIIFGDRPAYQGAPYIFLEQSFEALSATVVCAGDVMGLPLLVSDYRQEHILKRSQVIPASPAMVLAVHVTIYAAYSPVPPVLVYASAALLLGYRMQGSPAALPLCHILVMLSMFSISMMVGDIAPDMKSANVATSVLYFPVLISSGATLPHEVMSEPIQKVAGLTPLTQKVKLPKVVSLDQEPVTVWTPMTAITGVFLLCSCISLHFLRREQLYLGKEIRHAHLLSFLLIIRFIHKGKKTADICLQAAGEIMQSSCSGGVQEFNRGMGSYRFWLIKRTLRWSYVWVISLVLIQTILAKHPTAFVRLVVV